VLLVYFQCNILFLKFYKKIQISVNKKKFKNERKKKEKKRLLFAKNFAKQGINIIKCLSAKLNTKQAN